MDYEQLVTAIDSASQALLGRAAQAVNQALVVRNWLIGAHLLEFEQSGQDHTASGYFQIWQQTSRRAGSRGWGLAC